jgi:hypothetical protein
MKRRVAVLGVGQTQHAARRADVSIPGLVREAVDRALADAGLEHRDIDAVVIGKAPDMLEGIAMPEQFLVGAVGGHMKRVIRVHTAGSVGASTAITAMTHVASGLYERVLCIAFEKQSEGNAMWALSPQMPFTPPLVAGAGGFFAPYCRAYIAKTGAPPHIGPMIAANARDNAGRNQYAHLREPMSVEDVTNSLMLCESRLTCELAGAGRKVDVLEVVADLGDRVALATHRSDPGDVLRVEVDLLVGVVGALVAQLADDVDRAAVDQDVLVRAEAAEVRGEELVGRERELLCRSSAGG